MVGNPTFSSADLMWRWVGGRVRHAVFLTSGLPFIREQSRSLPTSRLLGRWLSVVQMFCCPSIAPDTRFDFSDSNCWPTPVPSPTAFSV